MKPAEPYLGPDTGLPEILGITASRWAVLAHLLDHPEGATSAAISDALGLTQQATRFQLQKLAQAGAVASTLDPQIPIQGQRPTYFANREAVISALHSFARHAGITVIASEDLETSPLHQKLIARLRTVIRLIEQADGQA